MKRPRHRLKVEHNPAVTGGFHEVLFSSHCSFDAHRMPDPNAYGMEAQRAIEDGADRYCRTKKGKEQFATCYEREVRGRKKFYDGIMARYAHVQPR